MTSKAGYFRVPRGWSYKGYTLDLSSDSARMAVVRMWDAGKEVAGSFDSEPQLKELMGRYYRHVRELRDKGWLDGLDIHDWQEEQDDPDPTAAERQRRRRKKIAAMNSKPASVTPNGHGMSRRDVTEEVTPVTPRPRGRARTETETETETEGRVTPVIPIKATSTPSPPASAQAGRDVDPDDLRPPPKAKAKPVDRSTPPAPGFEWSADLDWWWNPETQEAWPLPEPTLDTGADLEVRVKSRAPAIQEFLHGRGYTASWGQIRKVLTEHPACTVLHVTKAVDEAERIEGKLRTPLSYITSPYNTGGVSMLEKAIRRERGDQRRAEHEANTAHEDTPPGVEFTPDQMLAARARAAR